MSSARYFGTGPFRNVLNAGVFGRRVEVSSLIGVTSNLHPFFGSCKGSGIAIYSVSRMPCQPSCAFECMLGRGGHGTQRLCSQKWEEGSMWEELAASSVANYLVDPASSHMLVSKIKPCMSKYKLLIL
jgi:hypothetical protein